MYCPYCGKTVPEGYKFCTHCGRSLQAAPQQAGQQTQPVADYRPQFPQGEETGYINSPKKARRKTPVLLAALVVVLLAGVTLGAWVGTGSPFGWLAGLYSPAQEGGEDAVSSSTPLEDTPAPSSALASSALEAAAGPTAAPSPTHTPEPTPAPTPAPVATDYYILPQSAQRLLVYNDIANFTKQDMMLARNEIYARHGRKFSDEDVRSYFEAQTWYKGTVEPEAFSASVLSDIEQANVEYLKLHEDGQTGISQNVGNSNNTVVTYGGYMIPQSSSRRLTYADIAGLSSWQLMIARNEIYARHGRRFNDADIQAYFNAQSWYSGTVDAENFDTSWLSSVEIYNIDFIQSYE